MRRANRREILVLSLLIVYVFQLLMFGVMQWKTRKEIQLKEINIVVKIPFREWEFVPFVGLLALPVHFWYAFNGEMDVVISRGEKVLYETNSDDANTVDWDSLELVEEGDKEHILFHWSDSKNGPKEILISIDGINNKTSELRYELL